MAIASQRRSLSGGVRLLLRRKQRRSSQPPAARDRASDALRRTSVILPEFVLLRMIGSYTRRISMKRFCEEGPMQSGVWSWIPRYLPSDSVRNVSTCSSSTVFHQAYILMEVLITYPASSTAEKMRTPESSGARAQDCATSLEQEPS